MNAQTEARRIVAATTLPIPREESVARVEVEKYMELPPCTPEHDGCLMIAQLVWQWALENGCTIIEICKGVHHKHRFNVIDLAKAGHINPVRSPKLRGPKNIQGLAGLGHARTGSYRDTMKNYVPVGTTFSA